MTMITMIDDDDNMQLLVSQYYPDGVSVYDNQKISSSQETKVKRQRRRKGKKVVGERSSSEGGKKRKLSEEQVKMLEVYFGNEHKLESERKDKLAAELGLHSRQVAVWFQNRRARWKNKKLEEEFSKLKASHHSLVLHKCRLQAEVMQLKEQLGEATKEIQRLSDSSNSPLISSSVTMDTNVDPTFFGEFGVEGYETDAFYMPEDNYNYIQTWSGSICTSD